MLDEVGRRDLLDICADQWARSVARATADLAALAPGRCAEVRYEHLVADPTGEVTRLLVFLGLAPTPQVAAACAAVTEGNVGKWRQQLTPAEADRVQDLARAELERWGYL
ncbi:MAG: sulfotransferase [Candidatus Krumholzibacteriia bacterium]